MFSSLVLILLTIFTLVYNLVYSLQVVPETFPTHTSYLRSPRIVNSKFVHPQHRVLYDVVHARLPDSDADRVKGWKNVLEGRKQRFNSIKRRNSQLPQPPRLLAIDWGQNFNLIVTWTWKTHSNGLQGTRSHHNSDQSQQPHQIDQSTSQIVSANVNPTVNINSKISTFNISYFSLYLVHKSILEDMSNYVNSVQVFEVLPTDLLANCNQSLILSNLKPFAKYELYVTATNEYGQSAKSNSILFVNNWKYRDNTATFKESILILLSLFGWALLIYMFFKQWGAIKNLQPRETRYTPPKTTQTEVNNQNTETHQSENGGLTLSTSDNNNNTNQLSNNNVSNNHSMLNQSFTEPIIITAEPVKESRLSKIAKFRRMRDYRIGLLKNSSLKSLSSRNNSKTNLPFEIKNSAKQTDI